MQAADSGCVEPEKSNSRFHRCIHVYISIGKDVVRRDHLPRRCISVGAKNRSVQILFPTEIRNLLLFSNTLLLRSLFRVMLSSNKNAIYQNSRDTFAI